jgi:hypothetical protein
VSEIEREGKRERREEREGKKINLHLNNCSVDFGYEEIEL